MIIFFLLNKSYDQRKMLFELNEQAYNGMNAFTDIFLIKKIVVLHILHLPLVIRHADISSINVFFLYKTLFIKKPLLKNIILKRQTFP